MKRNRFIDLLKGICMLMIIVTHFAWEKDERLKFLFPYWIDLAVPVLMIITGYLSALSFERIGIVRIEQAYDKKLLLKKFLRFTVPFLMSYFVEIVINYIIYRRNLLTFFLYFFAGGWGPGTYYYPVMIQFIFVFPLIYFAVRKNGKKGLLMCFLINLLFEILQRAFEMNTEGYTMLICRYIFVISFGCYLALYSFNFQRIWYLVSLIIGGGFIYLFKYMSYRPQIINVYWCGTSLLSSLFVLPIVAELLEKCRFGCKPLEMIGKASFNVYLVHKVYYSIIEWFYSRIPGRPLQLIFSLMFCTVVGIIFYFVEQPITKKLSDILTENS